MNPMNPLNQRLQALHWLFAATGHWLFKDRKTMEPLPHRDDVNWKVIGDLGYFHNVEPILYRMVSNAGVSMEIPQWLIQKWEQAYFGNFLRNEEYLGILKRLLQKCETAGISIIVLKGPALIGRIYKDPALRTLSDLDILCSRGDLPGMITIGRRMGYTLMEDGDDPAADHHVAMGHGTSRTILEFHFMPYEIIQNHERFMQWAWERREWITVGDLQCPVLCLEMEILFNIAHLVQHQLDVSLKHYLDIAGFLVFYKGQLDRDGLGMRLRDLGLEPAFSRITGFLSTMMHLPHVFGASRLTHENSAQLEFDSSLLSLLALLDEERLLDVRGFIWRFRIAFGNRVGFLNKMAFVIKTLLPFSDNLTDRETRSSGGDFRYFLRHFRFYCKRLFLTLTHFPKEHPANRKHSLAKERAGAKNRVTRQLQKIVRGR